MENMTAEKYVSVFERKETKYVLTRRELDYFLKALSDKITPDAYGHQEIYNIYYDTRSFAMVRNSIEKPQFREKLRLRSYGAPSACSTSFLEMKRKAGKTVYKRRVSLPWNEAVHYMQKGVRPANISAADKQIYDELDYFRDRYRPVPMMYLKYARTAYAGVNGNDDLRITVDSDIMYSAGAEMLRNAEAGKRLLPADTFVVEIKTLKALPVWLVRVISQIKKYPSGFSKYGLCYQDMLNKKRDLPEKTTAERKEKKSA